MSMSAALLISQSGLRATELRASHVSSNIANAQTDGYVRRGSAQSTMGGGTVDIQTVRRVDERLIGASRDAASDVAYHRVRADHLDSYLTTLGDPSDALSPAARLSDFVTGLDILVNNPADTAVQRDVLQRADGLVRSLGDAARDLSNVRETVIEDTGRRVAAVNAGLERLAELNAQIVPGASATPAPEILDQIGRELSDMAEHLAITARFDATGRVQVQTSGGSELLRHTAPATLDFNGQALFVGDIDITPGRTGARGFASGAIAGNISLLAEDLPRMSRQLDEMARVLVEGFEDADASLGAGQAGLFTDGGNPYDAAAQTGLAGRLAVNDAVRPEAGGALWRLRDGIGAATQGDSGASAQIDAFIRLLDGPADFDVAAGLGGRQRPMDFASSMVAAQQNVGVEAGDATRRAGIAMQAFDSARGEIEGVNMDEELQKLLLIEQSYGANAKVLSTLNEMLDDLLRAF